MFTQGHGHRRGSSTDDGLGREEAGGRSASTVGGRWGRWRQADCPSGGARYEEEATAVLRRMPSQSDPTKKHRPSGLGPRCLGRRPLPQSPGQASTQGGSIQQRIVTGSPYHQAKIIVFEKALPACYLAFERTS